jgi:4-amino-4-deoxy-L-arabinose transferase-like glycosyltransferase
MKKILIICLVFFLGLGFFARLWQFGQVPVSLYWDEAAIGLDARALLLTGQDLNGHSWLQPMFVSYGDYKAPVYIWLTTLLGKFLSVSELTVRLPSLLASFGIAWLLFKWLGPFVAVSFLIMPWSVHFSRIGFESHLSLFWLVLAVYLVIKRRVIWGSLAVILGIYTYFSLRIIAPVLFVISFLLYSRTHIKAFIIGLILIGVSLLILVKSPDYYASQQYRLSNDNLITSNERKVVKLQKFVGNYAAYFDPQFLLVSGDPNLRHHSGWGGELLLVQGILLVIGFVALLTYPRRETILIISWLLLSPAVAALVNETPHASRAIYLIIPLAWLIGLGWSRLKTKFALIIAFLLLLNFSLYLHDYFIHYPDRSALAWIKPYKDAALRPYNTFPVYVDPKLYKPELYFAFYLNDLSLLKPNEKYFYYLPTVCPQAAICIKP